MNDDNKEELTAGNKDKEDIIHVDQGFLIVVQCNLRIASEENWL